MTGPNVWRTSRKRRTSIRVSATYVFRPVPDLLKFHSSANICTHLAIGKLCPGANQRKAIIEGLQVSIEQFQKVVDGASAKEVMQLVMVTQYFDTLKSIGESDRTNTLFLAHSPGVVRDLSDQILQSMLVAEKA